LRDPMRASALRGARGRRVRGRLQVLRPQRMAFHRDEMQALRALRIAAPSVPSCQEVASQTKAGFKDDKLPSIGPSARKIIACKKDVPRLSQRTLATGIPIAVAVAVWKAARIKLKCLWL